MYSRPIWDYMQKELIEKYKGTIVRELGVNLEALILVGSFSRDEGIDGLSDIEFLAVIKNLLNGRRLFVLGKKVTIGFTTRKHLARLKPYIFTVETKKFGRVLWGDHGVLGSIPDYSYEDIAVSDAFTLLNNRIVEQLILWRRIKKGEAVLFYDLAKGYVQIANSILAFHHCYQGRYAEKEEAIRELFKERNDMSSLFPGLQGEMVSAFKALRDGSVSKSISAEEALNKWKELRTHMKRVWEYEGRALSYSSVGEKVRDLFKAVVKRGVPRFVIYRDALREYFSANPSEARCADITAKWKKFVK